MRLGYFTSISGKTQVCRKLLEILVFSELTHPFKGANFACSPNGRISGARLNKEVVAMLHCSSADAGFDFVTQLPIPCTTPKFNISFVPPAFSADGLKFAVAAKDGTVSVWDIRNKIPLVVKKRNFDVRDVDSLQFSSGTLGREVLAFTEVSQLCLDVIFFMLNKEAAYFR